MIEAKVYLIKSDTKTECHCGHEVQKDEEYYMIRTNVPKWLALCRGCVSLLSSPTKVDMQELVRGYFETRPPDGKGRERWDNEKRKEERRLVERRRLERVIKDAEWM